MCMFSMTTYLFGIKGWGTEIMTLVSVGDGFFLILTGIITYEIFKLPYSRWKIFAFLWALLCVPFSIAVIVVGCFAIPWELNALDTGLVREITYGKVRIGLYVVLILCACSALLCTGALLIAGWEILRAKKPPRKMFYNTIPRYHHDYDDFLYLQSARVRGTTEC